MHIPFKTPEAQNTLSKQFYLYFLKKNANPTRGFQHPPENVF